MGHNYLITSDVPPVRYTLQSILKETVSSLHDYPEGVLSTYESAVRALIPLVISSVALPVQITGALGRVGKNLELLGPGLRRAERGSAKLLVSAPSYTHAIVV